MRPWPRGISTAERPNAAIPHQSSAGRPGDRWRFAVRPSSRHHHVSSSITHEQSNCERFLRRTCRPANCSNRATPGRIGGRYQHTAGRPGCRCRSAVRTVRKPSRHALQDMPLAREARHRAYLLRQSRRSSVCRQERVQSGGVVSRVQAVQGEAHGQETAGQRIQRILVSSLRATR